jgi:phosphatidylinositol alpha-mannosyltransferase
MRILVVTPYDLSHDGGVNRHVRSLAVALVAHGHDARVLGPASGAVPDGCDALAGVVPLLANGSVARIGLLTSAAATGRYLAKRQFDLLHVHEPLVPGPGRQSLGLATVPVVATFHASAESEPSLQRVLRRVAAAGLGRIDFGIAVSREAKRFSRAIYRGRTAVVPNGVDLSRFGGALARADLARPRRVVPQVLFVGRFGERRKGLLVLLEAVSLLRAQGRPVAVRVVGEGPRERFARRAEALGVTFDGRVSDAALAAAYHEADVFCAPSLGGESFGMVLVEAMAAGCPVVASDLPGYVEAARGAALLFPRGDPGQCADGIWRAATDEVLARRLADRGRARASALCWSRVAGHVLRIYGRALGPRPALEATA